MKPVLCAAALALAATWAVPGAAFAANANHPYSNVDNRVDAGNNPGDAQVEQLNQAQLGGTGVPPRRTAAPIATAPATAPVARPGYVAAYPPVAVYPAPVYAPPPYAYYPPPYYVAYPRPFYFVRPPFFYPY